MIIIPEHSTSVSPAVLVPGLKSVSTMVSSPDDNFCTNHANKVMISPAFLASGLVDLQLRPDDSHFVKMTVCSPPVVDVMTPVTAANEHAIFVPPTVSIRVLPLVPVNLPFVSAVVFPAATSSPLEADAVAEATALMQKTARTAITMNL